MTLLLCRAPIVSDDEYHSKYPCFPGVDGGFTRWSLWSECDARCGGGVQARTRNCTNPPPQGHGKTCDGPLKETRPCNEQPCSDGNKNIHCII